MPVWVNNLLMTLPKFVNRQVLLAILSRVEYNEENKFQFIAQFNYGAIVGATIGRPPLLHAFSLRAANGRPYGIVR